MMKTTTVTIKVMLSVNVDVEVEMHKLSRQATVVDAKISNRNMLTPRMVYMAMKAGDFNTLDAASRDAFNLEFEKACAPYLGKLHSELPGTENEIRGLPMHPKMWARAMTTAYGGRGIIPAPLITEAIKRDESSILIEPVLSRVPTVYIWNLDLSNDVLDDIAKRAPTMKNPQVERLEEGSLRLRWNR